MKQLSESRYLVIVWGAKFNSKRAYSRKPCNNSLVFLGSFGLTPWKAQVSTAIFVFFIDQKTHHKQVSSFEFHNLLRLVQESMHTLYKRYDYRLYSSVKPWRSVSELTDRPPDNNQCFPLHLLTDITSTRTHFSVTVNFSLERRWSIHSFRYGCLVTTSPLLPVLPWLLLWNRIFGYYRLPWCDGRLSSRNYELMFPSCLRISRTRRALMHFLLEGINLSVPRFR